MNDYVGEDFRKFKDHSTYFVTEDALAPLSHDIAFSPTRKYYCGANCQVCYIKKKLNEHHPFYAQSVPDAITDKQTALWYDIFSYFYTIRVVDDMKYLKEHHRHVYDWYKEHASTFEYGMTDNAIITQHESLMELNMKALSEVTLSEEFLNKVNSKRNYNKVMEIMSDYIDKYNLHKIKVIKTSDKELEYHAIELVEWLKDKGIVSSLHNDFRKSNIEDQELGNTDFDLNGVFDYQNTHILCYNDRTYQIYRGALHLYGDRVFYSIDDASDINWEPFHTIGESFNPENFIADMVKGKLKLYGEFANELKGVQDRSVQKFVDYYINSHAKFNVNDDFNFIPKIMLSPNSVFYNRLIKNGYRNTDIGLYMIGDHPKPIIDFKE